MDGGSTDGSVDLIRTYEASLAFWRSEQDDGQAAAIAEGLAMGDGDVVAWLNSDDVYPPGAFKKVAKCFASNPELDVIYGDCEMIDEHSNPLGVSTHFPVSWQDLFETPYLINQEATFVRRQLYEKVGGVDTSYWGAMDYDLWLRLFYEGQSYYLQEILGIHRIIPDQKSSRAERYIEEMRRARAKFAIRYAQPVPPWPASKEGWERVRNNWELHWAPVLEWIKRGCPERELTGAVQDMWKRYARTGVLSVRGGTSYKWVGPEALYILDREVVGATIEWIFSSPFPGLTADSVELEIEGRSLTLEVDKEVPHVLTLPDDKRFVVVRMTADKSFVPALENWGPAYYSLSLSAIPRSQGKEILSVQSIPCLPSIEYFNNQEGSSLGEMERQQAFSTVFSAGTSTTSPYSNNQRPLRVGFFSAFPANVGSGNERLVYATAKSLVARGHDARIYVMNAHFDEMPPFYARQLPKVPLESRIQRLMARMTGWNDIFFPSTALLRFRRWVGSADIWHFHNLHGHYMSIPLLGLISWTKRILLSPVDQYLSTGHCPYTMDCDRYLNGCVSCPRPEEDYPGMSRDATRALWQVKRLFFRLSRVKMLFHTQALADHYGKTFVRRRASRVIHYGVDLDCYRPLPRTVCAHRLGLEPSKRFVVGLFHSYVLQPRKGILQIVEKLVELAKQFPQKIELLVVGHGSEAVKDVFSPELSVTALPFLHHAHDLANALNLCDVLLYPTKAENLSLTCLCALACGVPVISYDAGGQSEAIKLGLNGFIVDVDDCEAMLSSLRKMLENPLLCQGLSQGARRYAEMFFDFDSYIDNLLKYYYEIIS
jgi:glycosyltransferase involved in cell wall biosynthesis